LATVDAVYVPPDIVSVAVLELVTPAAVEAVMLPVIVTEPVELLKTPIPVDAKTEPLIVAAPLPKFPTPYAVALLPPVTVPVMLTDPVVAAAPYTQMPVEVVPPVQLPIIVAVPLEVLYIAIEFAPKQLPVIVVVPLLLFVTAMPFKDDPLVQFPVIESVPLLVFITAPKTVEFQLVELAPVMLPTILAVAGEAAVNCRQFTFTVALLCVTFAVNVTPEFRMKSPVPAFESSVQVTFAVIVTVWVVEALASSAAPGTMPPTQVAPALKFPLAAERISAIFYRPFA
jgi:hypothetical protein